MIPQRPIQISRSAAALVVCLGAVAAWAGDPRVDLRVSSADGLSLFVRQYGKPAASPPIVLLTGGPGISGDYFEPTAERLAQRWTVLLPDQRGTGRSLIEPWDAARVTIDACIADVEALRKHLGSEKVTPLGHSWGGVLAMAYAAKHPQRVAALVLVGAGGPDAGFHASYAANVMSRLTPAQAAAVQAANARLAEEPERAVIETMHATAPAMVIDADLARRLSEDALAPGRVSPKVTLAMQGWLSTYDLRAELRKTAAPVLVIIGRADPIGEPTARDTAQAFPQGALEVIDGAAHWPFAEQPDAFAKAVEAFLAGGR